MAFRPETGRRSRALPLSAILQEPANLLGQRVGLVLGDEGVAVLDQDEAPIRNDLRDALAVLRRKEAIVRGPCDEDRFSELVEALGSSLGVLRRDVAEDLVAVSTNSRPCSAP